MKPLSAPIFLAYFFCLGSVNDLQQRINQLKALSYLNLFDKYHAHPTLVQTLVQKTFCKCFVSHRSVCNFFKSTYM